MYAIIINMINFLGENIGLKLITLSMYISTCISSILAIFYINITIKILKISMNNIV